MKEMIQKIFNIREKTTAIPLKNLSNNLFHWLHIWNSSDKQTIWQKYRNNDGNNSLKNVNGEGEKLLVACSSAFYTIKSESTFWNEHLCARKAEK